MKSIPYILLLFVMAAPYAYGSEGLMSGQQLLRLCESPQVSERSTCFGFIRGITETEIANETLCMDDSITYRHTLNKSVEHMNSHPQFLHESAVLMLLASLKEVYPCEHSEH